MKYLIIILSVLFMSCEEDICDCQYVSYTDGKETYRSSWDSTCESEILDESVYTYSDGSKSYTKTVIECR